MRRIRRFFGGIEDDDEYDVEAQTLLALLIRLRFLRQAISGEHDLTQRTAPEMHRVPPSLALPFSLRRDSLKVVKNQYGQSVEFLFDCTIPCSVQIGGLSPASFAIGVNHLHTFQIPQETKAVTVVLSAGSEGPSERSELDLSSDKPSVVSQSVILSDGSVMQFEEFFAGERCVICFSDTTGVAVLPCKHLSMCFECADLLRSNTATCPVCQIGRAHV